jgi:hypothetical protein
MNVSRRHFVLASTAFAATPNPAFAATPREITWDDLIPADVPYGEIIGEGQRDEQQDTWLPVFDENASKLNPGLKGAFVKIPGYIVPFDQTAFGITSFILVPYVGACVHTPPPPPNQLIFVKSDFPWKQDNLWDPVWVTGIINHETQVTDIAESGYALLASKIEVYEWD